MAEVLSAVTHIHANGIIHLDIKSQNIMPQSQRSPGDPVMVSAETRCVPLKAKVDACVGHQGTVPAGRQQGVGESCGYWEFVRDTE